MRRRVGVALAALLLATAGPAEASNWHARQQALQNQQARLNQKLGAQRAKAQFLRKKEAYAVGDLTSLQQKLDQTATELQDSQYRLRRAEAKLTFARVKLDDAKTRFTDQQRAAASRLRAIYKNKSLSEWEALLNAEDMGTFLMRYHYFKRVSDHDAMLLDDLDRQRQAIFSQQRQWAQQRQNIARVTEVIGTQKIQLHDMTGEQKKLVTAISTERAGVEAALAQLEADNQQIEAMVRRMIAERRRQEMAAAGGSATNWVRPFMGTGRFMYPVNGVVTSPYGQRHHPILGYSRPHHGIDFGAGMGTPIFAPDTGEVIMCSSYGGYGNVVMLDHGGDLTTLYGHTSRYAVTVGQKVQKGQIIAYVGSTGMSTGPHLHFEVRKNGAAVNPMNYIR